MTTRTSTIKYNNIAYTGTQDDWLFTEYYKDENGLTQSALHPDAWLYYQPEAKPQPEPEPEYFNYSITYFNESFDIDYHEELITISYDYDTQGNLKVTEGELIEF